MMQQASIIEQDGKKYQIDFDDFSTLKMDQTVYNTLGGYITTVSEEDDLKYMQDNCYPAKEIK